MNEEKARELVEKFPDWLKESSKKSLSTNDLDIQLMYTEGIRRAKILVSFIQWFIHVLYRNGYEVKKK